MQNVPRRRPGDAGGSEIIRALTLLARKGARARLESATAGGARIFPRGSGDGPAPAETGTLVAAPAWGLLVARGWVEAMPEAGLYALAPAGLTHLKRHLSAVRDAVSAPGSSREPARRESAEGPIAWLARHRDKDGQPLITPAQKDAADRLSADMYFAGMSPRVTTNWSAAAAGGTSRRSAPGAGVELRDAVMAAGERVRRALAAVGPELAGVLIDVCGHAKPLEAIERGAGWPQRTAKIVLRVALAMLARHYGLEKADGESWTAPHRIRHWGAEGFRPALAATDPSERPSVGPGARE